MVQSVVALIVSWRFASLSLPCFTKTRGWADRTCTHLIQFKPCRRLADHECRLRNSCLFMDMSSLTRAYWLTCRRIKVFVCLASREVHFEVTVGVMTPSMRSPQGKQIRQPISASVSVVNLHTITERKIKKNKWEDFWITVKIAIIAGGNLMKSLA